MIRQIISNIFCKNKYNYVCDCPRCGSSQTGYVINDIGVVNYNVESEKLKKLLNGEIVEVHSFVSDENTLFCLHCGLNWSGRPKVIYLNEEEIEKEKKRRGIDEEFINKRNISKDNLRILKKAAKQNRKKNKKQQKKNKIKIKELNNFESTAQDNTEFNLTAKRGPKIKSYTIKYK